MQNLFASAQGTQFYMYCPYFMRITDKWIYFIQLFAGFAEDKAAVGLIHHGRVNSMAVIYWGIRHLYSLC